MLEMKPQCTSWVVICSVVFHTYWYRNPDSGWGRNMKKPILALGLATTLGYQLSSWNLQQQGQVTNDGNSVKQEKTRWHRDEATTARRNTTAKILPIPVFLVSIRITYGAYHNADSWASPPSFWLNRSEMEPRNILQQAPSCYWFC